MMDPSKIDRPVATVDRNAWYLRFYLWLWVADVEKVDFCRLFWGYVFAIPMLLVRAVLVPVMLVWDFLVYMRRKGIWKIIDGVEWVLDRTVVVAFKAFWKMIPAAPVSLGSGGGGAVLGRGPTPAPIKKKRKRKPSKFVQTLKTIRSNGGEMFLSSVGKTADKGVETAQTVWPYVKWFAIAIGAVLAAALAFGCGYLIWLLIKVMPVVANAVWIAISAAATWIAWLTVTIFTSPYAWIVPLLVIGVIALLAFGVAVANARPTKVAAKKVGDGTMGFGSAMKMGVKSVKYRTCPVIKIEE